MKGKKKVLLTCNDDTSCVFIVRHVTLHEVYTRVGHVRVNDFKDLEY